MLWCSQQSVQSPPRGHQSSGTSMQRSSSLFRIKACAAGVTAALSWSGLTQAADAPASPQGVEEINITGTRITREAGFDMPTPVTVLGETEINAEAPSSIADFVNTLP